MACVLIPGFELRAALRARPSLALRPAALAPAEGEEPLIGPITAAAEAQGVKPGMRMGEALATCPELVLVEQDPSAAEQAWEEILRRLRGVMGERTSILVSHRVSTVRGADQILVFDDGRVVERGTHDELLRLGGLYAALARHQQLEDELAAIG